MWAGFRRICAALDGELWRHSIVIGGQARDNTPVAAFEAYLRDIAYMHLVLLLVDEATAAGARPIMHFDSQKKVILNKAVHGWAERAFNTSELTLAHAFLCHGIPVPEPTFVEPASTPGLELADALSFATARHLFRVEQSKPSDVDLGVFGHVKFITTDTRTGDLLYALSVGWPWKHGWQD